MAKFQRTPQPHHSEATEDTMDRFVDWVNELLRRHYEGSRLPSPTVSAQWGPTNIKIVLKNEGQPGGSVWCFVERSTGCIMKAAGWKAPEPKRYERGNIHLPEGWSKWLEWTGPRYLN